MIRNSVIAIILCVLLSVTFLYVRKPTLSKNVDSTIADSDTRRLVATDKVDSMATREANIEDKVPTPSVSTKVSSPTLEKVPETVYSIDVTKLHLGDGNRSINPKKGYVYSCQTTFSVNAGGASKDGEWIHGDTWNLKEKISVQGSVKWSAAWFKEQLTGAVRILTGNGLPVGSYTGTFPIAVNDPAYQIDRNPNKIQAIDFTNDIPSNPVFAVEPTCVPMGIIGRALNGVAIYNALDGRGDDAVAHEVQDSCNGHPERTGEYHYHGPSSCIEGADKVNTLIGYALDGFGIYSRFDKNGKEYTNNDLDECHGITNEIEWNGKKVTMYHYVLTQEYPYTIGCFKGTPSQPKSSQHAIMTQDATAKQRDTGTQPPAQAIAACVGKNTNSVCVISTPEGAKSGICRIPPGQSSLACIPQQ